MAKLTDKESLLKELDSTGTRLLYSTDWCEETVKNKNIKMKDSEVYVLIGNEKAVVEKFVCELVGYDCKSIAVYTTDKFEKCSDTSYYVSRDNKEDVKTLLNTLMKDHADKTFRVLYINSYCKESVENISKESLREEENNCGLLLYLVQTITDQNWTKNFKLSVLVNNIHGVDSSLLSIYQSTLWGFAKTIALEHPNIWSKIIDVDYAMLKDSTITILKEWFNGEDGQVLLRGEKRLIPKLVHYSFKGDQAFQSVPISENGYYIITGGTGMIGQTYMEGLIEAGAKNIILICRKNPKQEVQESIDAWKTKGINIMIEKTDVSNYDQLKSTIDQYIEDGAVVKGVVHAAGMIKDRLIKEQCFDTFSDLFSTKVYGTYYLHEILINQPLDFFVMMSSITALVGNYGQANYAAANYFMNTFAEYRQSLELPALALCWGPWADGGMAANGDVIKNSAQKGLYSISQETGKKMAIQFIGTSKTPILCADIDWGLFAEKLNGKEVYRNLSQIVKTVSEEKKDKNKINFKAELQKLSKKGKKDYMISTLQKISAQIMGFSDAEDLSEDKSLLEQGADSIILFSIMNEVKSTMEVDIDVSIFFKFSSLRNLGEYLLSEVITLDETQRDEQAYIGETAEKMAEKLNSMLKNII
jgi:short-subunit dehydrogenase/acyl carrier protein